MRFDLSASNWEVRGYYPWIPLKERSMETGKTLDGVTDWLPAQVPGGVHLALYRAGLIPYPYDDRNSLACEWVENRWWYYRTEVPCGRLEGDFFQLIFEGVDDTARIYVNGVFQCRHVGMFEPIALDVTAAVRQNDVLRIGVLIEHAPDENGQIGHTSDTFTQKSRFGYKWDFGTRLVNLGIWKPCYILGQKEAFLDHVHTVTDVHNGVGLVDVSCRLGNHGWERGTHTARFRLCGHGCEQTQEVPCIGNAVHAAFSVEQPALWYPNGYGEQPLYTVSVELLRCGQAMDSYTGQIGIRSLTYRQNEGSPESALPYTFVVNGCPVYICGVNMTPLDHVYGDVTEDHYRAMVTRMQHMHVNLVRVWGGGLIESEVFYRLCDQAGILVWQELIQSSSGLDNIPSKRPEFLLLLTRAARAAIESCRNHTCLAVWSGGNELMNAEGVPAGYEDTNLSGLRDLVRRMDPQRLFLPTSASGPREFISTDPGVSHDVHGHWNYGGDPGHYALYSASDSLFHSEFGCEGMCGYQSLMRHISQPYQQVIPVKDSPVYRHHGEWWDTLERDETLFGPIQTVETLQQCSQWIQAEGLRFILEANRRRKFQNSGSIIWQLNEPWPNVYCTNLIDYDLTPKMAYYWCRNAYAPASASLDYRTLRIAPGTAFAADVVLVADGQADVNMVRMTAFLMDGRVLGQREWTVADAAQRRTTLGRFELPDLNGAQGLLYIRLETLGARSRVCNEYFFGAGSGPVYASAQKQPLPEAQEEIYAVKNNAASCAMHVHPICESGFDVLADQAYFTLLPGECVRCKVRWTPQFSSGFLMREVPTVERPVVKFQCFAPQGGAT